MRWSIYRTFHLPGRDRVRRERLFGRLPDPLRAGDLVEIRARGGLSYAGKMNVNEQHDILSPSLPAHEGERAHPLIIDTDMGLDAWENWHRLDLFDEEITPWEG
jgi:hypothetical protein